MIRSPRLRLEVIEPHEVQRAVEIRRPADDQPVEFRLARPADFDPQRAGRGLREIAGDIHRAWRVARADDCVVEKVAKDRRVAAEESGQNLRVTEKHAVEDESACARFRQAADQRAADIHHAADVEVQPVRPKERAAGDARRTGATVADVAARDRERIEDLK